MADIVNIKSRRDSSSDEDSGRLAKKPRTVHPPAYGSVRITTQGDIDSLYPLIVAYIETPSLADTITDFAIDINTCNIIGSGFADSDCEVSPRPVEEKLHAAVESYARNMGLGDEALRVMLPALEWKKQQLRDGVHEPRRERIRHERDFATTASAILLSLCKNITTLHLGSLGPFESPFQLYMLLSGMDRIPQPGLRMVAKVEVIGGSVGSTRDLREYASLSYRKHFNYICRLPALESVVLEGVADQSGHPQTLPLSAFAMKKISIRDADISSRVLGKLLQVPKRLEELSLSFRRPRFIYGGSAPTFARTIGEHLSKHRETLRILDLDMDYSNSSDHGYDSESDSDRDEASAYRPNPVTSLVRSLERQPKSREPSPSLPRDLKHEHGSTVGSFNNYKAMTHLSIGIMILLGPTQDDKLAEQPRYSLIEALPPSLEYLCLYGYERGDNTDVDNHVDEFLEERGERLPFLNKVKGLDEKVDSELSIHEGQGEDSSRQRPKHGFGWARV